MPDYRLFIAVELPDEVQQELAGVQKQLQTAPAVRWTKPHQIHLTLQFLGNTPAEQVAPLSQALQETVGTVAGFNLLLAKIGAFPNAHRARIIWAGIATGKESLQQLYQAVINATQSLGFEPEKRAFKPHLTIGRVQKWATPRDLSGIAKTLRQTEVGSIAAFPVNQIALIKSELKPSGPVYTPLAHINLG